MLDKIPKISMDHCLLDSKGIMQKYSTVFLDIIFNRKMGVAAVTPLIAENNSGNFIDHKLLDAEGILKKIKL